MFWLKACPRCRGDLHEVRELDGRYVSCLQCGQTLTERQEKALPRYYCGAKAPRSAPQGRKVAA